MYEDERFETRDLFVELTTDERQDRANRYVECDAQIEKLKGEQKASNDRYKRDIGALVNKKENLGRAVQDGKELREIECEWVENFEQKCWDLVRLDLEVGDDGRLVDQRAMTANELQSEIEFENENENEEEEEEEEQNDDDDETVQLAEDAPEDDEYSDPEEPEYEPPPEPVKSRGKKKAATKKGGKKKTAGKKSK